MCINVYENIDMRISTYYNIDMKGGHTMPMTSKQMVKLLKQNGFIEIRQAGSHKILNNPVTIEASLFLFMQKIYQKALKGIF